MSMNFKLRNLGDGNGGSAPCYGGDDYFTIELHHGGVFACTPHRVYKGGRVNHFDYCEPDKMSLLEINDMMVHLGYEGTMKYYCKIPGSNLGSGLRALIIDTDLMVMMTLIPSDRVLEIYVELDSSHAVIEELTHVNSVEVRVTNVRSEDESSDQEEFVDSDYGLSDDDDALFDANVDTNVEWVGLREGNERGKKTYLEESSVAMYEGEGEIEGLSDYAPSDELHSCDGSSDEEGTKKKMKYPEFRVDVDMKDVEFKVGMLFSSTKEFKDAVREYAITKGKGIRFLKNDKTRVRAICSDGCKWLVFASKLPNQQTLQVKTYINDHTCTRKFYNKNVKSGWLSRRYVDNFRSNPQWPIESFMETVRKDLIVGVSKSQVYRAKRKAMVLIQGSHTEHFSKLWDYCEEIKRTNPRTTMVVQVSHSAGDGVNPRFERLYVCLGACKKGFKDGCRKLIGVDGCHLKGPYGGQLLTAVGIDSNNCMFPLAYAIVEGETKSSWMWFLELLAEDVGIVNQFAWTFISDKQKGLIPAMQTVLPNSDHRFCVRHFYNNFKLKFKGKALKDRLWNASRATTIPKFDYEMGELKKLDVDAYNWLAAKSAIYWSRSHFSDFSKCDILLNNLCETFNAYILEARDKPILTLLERIRCMLMRRMQVKREAMRKFQGCICPKIQKKLEKIKEESASCIPLWSGGSKFQINCMYGDQYSVNLDERTCSCRKWDLSGIPCAHAVSAIFFNKHQPEDYVDMCYNKETYMRSYEPIINPVDGPTMWPKTGGPFVLPPIMHKQPGRPKMRRRKEPDEVQNSNSNRLKRRNTTVKCSKCGKLGHNRKGCRTHVQENVEPPSANEGPSSRIDKLPVRRFQHGHADTQQSCT